jgi:uncharacterized protein YjiS (DUF1127 family)
MRLFVEHGSAALPGQSTQGAGFAGAVKQVFNKVAAPVRAYLEREATYRELVDLDDRMLADIGLARSDISAVASGLQRTRGGLAQRKFSAED